MREAPIACCAQCFTPYTWAQYHALELVTGEGVEPQQRACALCRNSVYLDTRGLGPAMFLEDDAGNLIAGPQPSIAMPTKEHRHRARRVEGASVALRVLLVLALLLWASLVGWLLWRGWWSK